MNTKTLRFAVLGVAAFAFFSGYYLSASKGGRGPEYFAWNLEECGLYATASVKVEAEKHLICTVTGLQGPYCEWDGMTVYFSMRSGGGDLWEIIDYYAGPAKFGRESYEGTDYDEFLLTNTTHDHCDRVNHNCYVAIQHTF